MDSPKENHEKVILLRFCSPFHPSISQRFANIGLILRGPMHVDHPAQELVPLGSVHQGRGVVGLFNSTESDAPPALTGTS